MCLESGVANQGSLVHAEENEDCGTFLSVLHPLEGTIVLLIAESLLTAVMDCFLHFKGIF